MSKSESDNVSERRLVENQQIWRSFNTSGKRAIKKLVAPAKQGLDLPVEFRCECSDMSCDARVLLSIKQYEEIHKRADRFAVVKGHEIPSIEKNIKEFNGTLIVEKERLSAT